MPWATVSLACIVIPWFIWLLGTRFAGTSMPTSSAAMKPIPSPAEISWQLQQEWGRPATIEEVAAVHQMLTSETNQAMLGAGITSEEDLSGGQPELAPDK